MIEWARKAYRPREIIGAVLAGIVVSALLAHGDTQATIAFGVMAVMWFRDMQRIRDANEVMHHLMLALKTMHEACTRALGGGGG